MKKLLITLLLISPFSFADWGDVYSCQMTRFVEIELDGTVKQYKLERFQFKLDSTEKAMVFGKGGYLNDYNIPLDPNRSWVTIPMWWASSNYELLHFDEGKLMSSGIVKDGITSITANCDKF